MTEKKLIHFSKEDSYQKYKDQVKNESIVWVSDSKKIITHKTEYQFIGWSILEPPPPKNVGDYILYDKNNKELVVVDRLETDLLKYKEDYSPVGIVVIPSEHNVWGTGEFGVMSLVEMCSTSPTTGSSNHDHSDTNAVYLVWSPKFDIEELENFTQSVQVTNTSDKSLSVHSCPFLPSDRFTDIECYSDPIAYYNRNIDGEWYAPSPYLSDDKRNPDYYYSNESFINACSDLDGKHNSQILLNLRGTRDYSSWLPTWNVVEDYPAVSCCDMFCPEGTEQGDWYLPSMGELGYVMPRWNVINNSISNIRNVWGDTSAIMLANSDQYWSSTERSENSPRHLSTSTGQIDTWGIKEHDFFVRAFTRILNK